MTTNSDDQIHPGRYIWGGNAGSHGIKFETDLAYALFVSGSLQQIPFRLATEMSEAGKWEDVVLFRDDLKEVWLFQAKHNAKCGDAIMFHDLFPDNCDGRKDFGLHLYLRSMLDARRKAAFKGYRMRFFIFTNKSLGDRARIEDVLSIEWRAVDKFIRWCESENCYQGFRPKQSDLRTLLNLLNVELIAVRDGLIELLEKGKVSDILVKYKTPLKNVMRLAKNRIQFTKDFTTCHNNDNCSKTWLVEELQKRFIWKEEEEIRTICGSTIKFEINQPLKSLFDGNSRNKQFPAIVADQDVLEFFACFTLCLLQPDPKKAIEDAIFSWMRQWIPPNELGKFSEAQLTLPRTMFYETFKVWHERAEKEKTFLSYNIEGKKCIQMVMAKLKQHLSTSVDKCYVPRHLEEDGKVNRYQISDLSFVEEFSKNSSYILIGEPGMGKTTWMEHIAFELQKCTNMQIYLIYLNKLHGIEEISDGNVFEILRSELSEMSLNTLKDSFGGEKTRLVVLLDAFDELIPSCIENVIMLMQELLRHQNVHLIVSGRKHKKDILETILKTSTICLVPFKYDEQVQFLKMYWNISSVDPASSHKFQRFATYLIEKLHSNIRAEHFCFTGLPLMIRMLAEIYFDDFHKFLLTDQEEIRSSSKLSILHLFEQFTCMSMNMQMKKILNQNAYSKIHPTVDKRFRINIEQFDLEHQLAALRQLGVKDLQSCKKNEICSQTTLQYIAKIHEGDQKSLLITVTADNRIEFVHRSYAEFFTAKYLFNNVTEYETLLLKILQRHTVVQTFFFLMVEDNFESSLQQMTTLANICDKDCEVAFLACSGDHVKIVHKLLEERSAKFMEKLGKGTLLHAAAAAGSLNVVSLLVIGRYFTARHRAKRKLRRAFQSCFSSIISTKADLNGRDDEGCTPLFLATRNGHCEIVQILVDHGADVDIQDNDGQSPLQMAYKCGHKQIFQILLDRSKQIDCADNRGKTLLHLASANGDVDIVKILLSRSANINSEDAVRWTPLHYAVKSGDLPTVNTILAHSPKIDAQDESGRTPLHWVALSGMDIAKILIDHKANVDALDYDGCSPLHLAFNYRHLDVITLLINHSANINIVNKHGKNLLHLATGKGDMTIVRLLLDHSANVNVSDVYGWTALHFASANGYSSIVDLLIQHSANVNVPTKSGQTSLLMAVRSGHLETVRILLQHKAVHTPDKFVQSPILLAAKFGYLEIAKLLIEHSANVNSMDVDGWTALHYAVHAGRRDLVELLLKNSASSTMKTRDGETPLDMALTKNDELITNLILEHERLQNINFP